MLSGCKIDLVIVCKKIVVLARSSLANKRVKVIPSCFEHTKLSYLFKALFPSSAFTGRRWFPSLKYPLVDL